MFRAGPYFAFLDSMETHKRHIIILGILGTVAMINLSQTAFTIKDWSLHTLLNINNTDRLNHARELMGKKYYKKSGIAKTETDQQLGLKLFEIVRKKLPKKHKKRALEVTNAIIEESSKYALDPFFIASIIHRESNFNIYARGTSGEIGLMQIMPSTGKWLSKKINIQWEGSKTLENPTLNIRLGSFYISQLRDKFNHGQNYLSAYNMGPKKLKTALKRNVRPIAYSSRVMKSYIDFYKEITSNLNSEKYPQLANAH